MKYILYTFLYLNIYTIFSSEGFAQDLHLKIEGEQLLSEGLTDSLNITSRFSDYLTLKKEVDTLQLKFQRLGFIESKLQELQKENDTLYVANFYFGKRYRYIKIYYLATDLDQKDLDRLSREVTSEYFIIPFEDIETSLNKINALQTKNGKAFAKLRLSEITQEEASTLRAQLVLNDGASRQIDSIIVKGYEKFPKAFLKYYAGVQTGKSFDQKKLVSQSEALNTLGFVKTIKPPEALFRRETTSVYFYLEKQNNNLFDGILGFTTNEETQKLEFNGYLNLELNNNLNFGEQLLINYKADGREQLNFRVKTAMPYLFKSPVGAELELKIFKRDSTFSTTDQQARITYQITPNTKVYGGYKSYESSNLLDEVIAGAGVEDYTSRYFIGGISYTALQSNMLFPVKSFARIDTEIGNRELMAAKENQSRYSVVAHHIFNLNARNSIYLQNSSSVLLSDTFLTNELFRFGGIISIRGFDENSIDASLFSVLNTEYRYQFNDGLYLHSIIDLAYFENDVIALQQKLYSFGLGLGLQTKAGIFKFNIANGNSEDQNFKFSNTKIHISLSSRF